MPDDAPPLRPADRVSLLQSLSYALRHGRSINLQELAWCMDRAVVLRGRVT